MKEPAEPTISIEKIDPAQAREMLTANKHNREQRAQWIARKDMGVEAP